ncbi:MAG: GNAT family N-acetyltransferase [Bullifex sp.]
MNILIDNACSADIPALEDICLLTSDSGSDGRHLYSDGRLVSKIYLTPYVLFDPSSCFVARLDGKPVGYIVSCTDSEAFYQYLNNEYLPSIRSEFTRAVTESDENIISMIKKGVEYETYPDYPAHLHIDILPEGQHLGLGRRLTETLWAHLKANGVKGVYLGVGGANTNAQAFYARMGYRTMINKSWGKVLVKDL